MIFYKVENGELSYIHHMPFDETEGLGKTKEELLKEGFLVESLPTMEEQIGKMPILKVDSANQLYYEYIDRPLSPEEKITQLEAENSFFVLEMLKAQEQATVATQQAASAEQANADLTLELIVKGVL
ncbi:hypothetical protein [Bacillus sp. AFS040349]|uniref:hypothetical protein n=1 Tax=Bacillus sp. AFS040349 TaxID=2033502 RepID=UPI000BFE0341|nr:hypothetical protein [Bacillus sp. AFS040349]PGT89225.1 hypothetical protein COD11_04295 [Bacillus sp. AFS040349]